MPPIHPSIEPPQIWPESAAITILGQAQRLADIADRAARAIASDDSGQRRALPPIGGVDPLDHLLAPLMLEIHVDVGRLVARARR